MRRPNFEGNRVTPMQSNETPRRLPAALRLSEGLGAASEARERPEWVHCIGFGSAIRTDGRRTWCGRDERPFFFDVDHAALNGTHGGRLVACRECVASIMSGLKNGHSDPEYASA